MKVKDYKDLSVWRKGVEIVALIYKTTKRFPGEEMFGFSSQMKRAAVSILSNIAEGFSGQHTKEYRQYLFVALGSCAELETQLVIAQQRRYVTTDLYAQAYTALIYESKMLTNLLKKLVR